MHRHFAGFWLHPRDCVGRHGRRHGFAGVLGGVLGHGDFGWHSFRAGRKLGAEDLQLVILALLSEKPAHGYEIIKSLAERSGGFYHPSPGMVYPALTYLEEIGYASVEAEGTRKLYDITDAGRAHLEENRGVADTMLAQLKWVGDKVEQLRPEALPMNVLPIRGANHVGPAFLDASSQYPPRAPKSSFCLGCAAIDAQLFHQFVKRRPAHP